eukprot:TRINITY_DN21301_c0_g1_i1.p1 TRINITY_DN21301_c0_g1~~TRINITY_DN21301_c0_g1_i1.p1  ORF type:complete len:319 (+),score=116.62 TRINITY_DN21301_c0_g1_i1:99-1055(+)
MAVATEFVTLEGRALSLTLDPAVKVGQVVAALRAEGVAAASYLVHDGARLPEDGSLEAVCGPVLVGEELVLVPPRRSMSEAKWHGDAMKRSVEKAQNTKCNRLTDAEMAEVHRGTRWILEAGGTLEVVEEVLQEREELMGSGEDGDYEASLETLCPIPPPTLQTLTEMGFPPEQCRRALWMHGLDVQFSLNTLLEADGPLPPISKAQFMKIRRERSARARPEPEFPTPESIVRATVQQLDSAMALLVENMRPAGRSRQSALHGALEDALASCSVDSKLLRRAFQQLVQHPQSIFDYLSDPVLSHFFAHLLDHAKAYHD